MLLNIILMFIIIIQKSKSNNKSNIRININNQEPTYLMILTLIKEIKASPKYIIELLFVYKFEIISFLLQLIKHTKNPKMNNKNLLATKCKPTSYKKYICGCGKTYTSYPAYSTHRKTKHDNIRIQGTIIPKTENPKRGRPCYQFKKNTKQSVLVLKVKEYYQGLTVIQIGLLKISQKSNVKILTDANEDIQHQIPSEFVLTNNSDRQRNVLSEYQINMSFLQSKSQLQQDKSQPFLYQSQQQSYKCQKQKYKTKIIKLMGLFIELMTVHMTKASGQALIKFIKDFAAYLLEREKRVKQQNQDLVDINLFNQYFLNSNKKDFLNQLCSKYQLTQQFFIDVSIILSHWMYKLDVCSQVIRLGNKQKK